MEFIAVLIPLLLILSAVFAGYTVLFLLARFTYNNYATILKINLYFWFFAIAFLITLAIINK